MNSTNYVPNKFPSLLHQVPYRIALVGEAPGADEVVGETPFIGVSGRWLDYLLNRVSILRSACYLGNVAQHQPYKNNIHSFLWEGPEIQSGLRQLHADIAQFNPNLCVLLGGTALRAAKGYEESITNWRGSLFLGAPGTPFQGRKCISTFHPASSLRVYEQTPLLLFDLKRARTQGESPTLVLPARDIQIARCVEDVRQYCHSLCGTRVRLGTDIEGYVDNLTCISFAHSPLNGFVVPFAGPGGNYWSAEDELEVWLEIKGLLEDPQTEKVLQNGLYDRFVLAYTYGILIRNVTEDTQYKHWEIYCELKKRLALQASIFTLEPYYKDERDADSFDEKWIYNGKDSCVTLEICNRQDNLLKPQSREHYRFNMDLQNPLLYMELRGMNYDAEGGQQEARKVRKQVYQLQHSLNKMVGKALAVSTKEVALVLMRETFCLKRSKAFVTDLSQIESNSLKKYRDNQAVQRALELCDSFPFTDEQNGALSMFLGDFLNTASSDQMQAFLYGSLGMPVQYNKKTKEPTTDALALMKLFKLYEHKDAGKAAVLKVILKVTNLRTQLETLEILCDPDGRIRCAYNGVGSVTGRLSCSQSPTRSGYNLQTVTKKQRRLFRADSGYKFWQCDLSGADGWTVAAHCARLGDPTMLEDYKYGLKPALILALMSLGEKVGTDREEIKNKCKELNKLFKAEPIKEGWRYMGTKRVQHGSNYLMQPRTMSDQVLQDSWKYGEDIVYVEPKICEGWQTLYFSRYYGVERWHRWVENEILTHKRLTTASGHTRMFFGRPRDQDTLRAALSHEPQANTSYVTNCAVRNLWNDRENRTSTGALVNECLHQVHDAVCGQFPASVEQWSVGKIRNYFANPLIIAGQSILIPYEGAYGDDWGNLDQPI